MTPPVKQKQQKSMGIKRVSSSTLFLSLMMRGHLNFSHEHI